MEFKTPRDTITLNDGNRIPVVGLGVYKCTPGEAKSACLMALKLGYRHIDTAQMYENEEGVGAAIKESAIPRNEIFVTTKLLFTHFKYEDALGACNDSLKRLGLDYVDLYILHSPGDPSERAEAYRALEDLQAQGRVRSIGVSNYGIPHLEVLLSTCRVKPAVNQIEVNPYIARRELVDFCAKHNIVVEAYSPLTKGRKLDDPKLVSIAQKYNRSPAQILLRWCVQKGYVVLPKSVNEQRIRENAELFDFSISAEDMATLDAFDEYLVTGWDPTVKP